MSYRLEYVSSPFTCHLSPASAGSRGCEAVEECSAGFLRSFGEVSQKAQKGSRLSNCGAPLFTPPEDKAGGLFTRFRRKARLPVLQRGLLQKMHEAAGLHHHAWWRAGIGI